MLGNGSHSLHLIRWFAAVLLPLLLAPQVSAQSGRRAQRKISVPPANPASESSEAPKPLTVLAESVRLLIGKQPTSKRFVTEDSIFASFIKRLNEYSRINGSS
jgi:hypothetical protein